MRIVTLAAAATLALATAASAQVTPEMKAKIAAIGDVVDPPSTAALYRPLHPNAPYAGVTVVRDQKYGPDARNILDVFTPATGAAKRPVLLFVPGGAGNKIEPVPGGDAFYDNVMLWAAKNGMTGVNMQRRGGGAWDATARDVSAAIQWVKANAAKYGGDPDRIFVWGHSAGAMSVANYLSHPETYGPGGVGVKGAVLMAGPYNLAPLQPAHPNLNLRLAPGGPLVGMNALGPQPNAAEQLEHSMLPGLKQVNIPLFVSAAELDPPMLVELAEILNRELTAAGRKPTYLIYKDHGHMSEIFAVNTADVSTSKPVLDWMKAIK
jgi:triacylglycerol lipase